MLTEQARVVALDAETVWVETIRQSSCGSCSARAGCGHGMLNYGAPRKQSRPGQSRITR
jgi:sigma-E factor negative regulatory protein RseC